jgi:hypothetical protein
MKENKKRKSEKLVTTRSNGATRHCLQSKIQPGMIRTSVFSIVASFLDPAFSPFFVAERRKGFTVLRSRMKKG